MMVRQGFDDDNFVRRGRGRLLLGRLLILGGSSRAHLLLLGLLPLLTPLAGLLHLGTASLGLVSQHLSPGLLSLLLVDVLHEDALVLHDKQLEHVTLGLQVELVVQVTVDLLRLPVSCEQPPEDTHPGDPEALLRGPGVLGTLPLAGAGVTPLASSLVVLTDTGPG